MQNQIVEKFLNGMVCLLCLILNNKLSFATTETDKIFPPLKDRFTIVDFEPYNQEELAQIVQLCLPDIIFSDQKCLLKIASTIRNNARSAVKRV